MREVYYSGADRGGGDWAIVTSLKLTFFHHNFVILEKNIRIVRPFYHPLLCCKRAVKYTLSLFQ